MPYKQEIIGKTFGQLTVIDIGSYHQEPSGHRRRLVKVRCTCGTEYETVYAYLHRKRGTKSCANCAKRKKRLFKVGQKFDKLTVSGYQTNAHRSMVICTCDCGTKNILIRAHLLKNNMTNNCGCAPRGHWNGLGRISKTFFYRLKRNAKVRKIKFLLTEQYLWNLFLKQEQKCALTGLSLDFNYGNIEETTASLDRIDSNKGYVVGNVWFDNILFTQFIT